MREPNASGVASSGTSPNVCFIPTTALHAAGMRVEPPLSVATASGVIPAATDTAAPPLDPPDVLSERQALRVRPNRGDCVTDPLANSGVVVLPTRMAPATFTRATASAS